MLLIGETGSGKTSFLNLICNYARLEKLGCNFDKEGFQKLQQFDDPDLENKEASEMESKTSGAKLYDVAADSTDLASMTHEYTANLDKLKFSVIDTPGFGDTRGFDRDEENLQNVLSCIEEEEYINCVCIVINGRQTRIVANLQYVLTGIASILPKQVLKNIFFVFTNVADRLVLHFKTKELKNYFGEQVDTTAFICIDNPYSKFERAVDEGTIKEKVIPILKTSFNETRKALKEMCCRMKNFEKVHTLLFTKLYKKKQEIEGSALDLLSAYDNLKKLEQELTSAQKEVNAALEKNSCTKKIPKAIPVDTSPVHNTLCNVPDCNSNCHLECRLPMSLRDETVLKNCLCMDLGKREDCKECGHSYKHHYHAYRKWEKKIIEVDLVNDEMRDKMKAVESIDDRAKTFKEGLENQHKESLAKRQELSAQLLEKIKEFEKLSVGRSYAKLIESQIGVIKLRIKGSLDKEVQDLKEVQEKLEERLKIVYETLSARQ